MDSSIDEFFRSQQEDAANNECCDSGSSGPLWASVSHGIYISIEAAGVHRSLGVRSSFVLSLTLDNWQPRQLRMMALGGNQRFHDFLSTHGIPQSMPIREKYSTRAAAWYRENLRAEAEGTRPPQKLPLGTGHLTTNVEPDPAWAVLDRVFASMQYNNDVKRCSMRTVVDFRSKTYALQRNRQECLRPSLAQWVCEHLGCIIDQGSEGKRMALKLQEMSTGSMEGFGFDKMNFDMLETSPQPLAVR